VDAEFILINGNFHTMDPARPRASAVAIRGDRFLAVGDNDEILAMLSPETPVIDLGGETVVPGFIDAHIHFMSYGLSLREIDLANVPSLEIALDRVRARAAETPAGQWLTGRGWDQSLWGDGNFPGAADLDAISSEHPIFLRRKCGHAGWANSAALQMAAITSATPDPDGGEIVRDSTGQPTGILLETAMHALFVLVAEPTDEQAAEAVREAQAVVHKMGIVGVHTMEGAPALRAFQKLRADGELRLRIVSQIPVSELDDAIRLGLQSGLGDEWLRIGGVKVFSDGALGPRTAWMLAPYENEPTNTGIAVTDEAAMADIVERATSAGLAVVTHAIGDKANRMVLDALEASRKAGVGLHLRHRIEHAQVLDPHDIPRFVELGVIPSMQPIHATQDMRLSDKHWGSRSRYAYAWRSLQQTGAPLAFGSDAPVETPDVIQGIHAAVTRCRADGTPGGTPSSAGWIPEERLTVEEAVWAYTFGAAYAGGMENEQGSITPGKLADLTFLSQDIFSVNPMAILETDVTATVVGGEFVYGGVE